MGVPDTIQATAIPITTAQLVNWLTNDCYDIQIRAEQRVKHVLEKPIISANVRVLPNHRVRNDDIDLVANGGPSSSAVDFDKKKRDALFVPK